jgi:hypothetical protein
LLTFHGAVELLKQQWCIYGSIIRIPYSP